MKNKFLRGSLIILFWLLIWQLVALIVGEELFVPSPLSVVTALYNLLLLAESWIIIFKSIIRVALGMLIATVLGIILACLTSKSKLLDKLFSPMISIIKATPVASFVILALIWLGSEMLPILICSLMALPLIWISVSDGIHAISKEDINVAKIFKFKTAKTIKIIYIPTIAPYFISASKTAVGLAWKAGVAAEVIAHTPLSIGKSLSNARIYYEIPDVFAWTVIVIILSMLIEHIYSHLITLVGKKFFYVRAYD